MKGRTVTRMGMVLGAVLSLAFALGPKVLSPQTAHAATGDFKGEVLFSQQCNSGIGVGVTFDGTYLWYSCYASNPDLLRADPHTGVVSATFNIAGGLGALAYDANHNIIWAGPGGTFGNVYKIQLDATQNVSSSGVAFNAGANGSSLDDGLAYDGQDNTLYVSPDGSTVIHHYTTAGVLLDNRNWAGNACYNSGVAIGGQLLFQGSDGCSHVWVTDKTTNALAFDFSTFIASDPNHRDEGLSCDTVTFAPTQVMWSKEAYNPQRAAAFEIPAGTCGNGGQPADTTPPTCALTAVIAGPPKQLQITVQDSDGGLKAVVVTSANNATVSVPAFTVGTTSPVVVTATKVDQTMGASVGLQVTDVAGNVTTCDPAVLNVDRTTGKPASTTAHGIARSERFVHIYNGNPGVATLTVTVNGKHFQVANLAVGQQATLDIAAALAAGSNTVTLTAAGQPGGGVIVLIADR